LRHQDDIRTGLGGDEEKGEAGRGRGGKGEREERREVDD
jgi:hypothetical protein